jgi:hypothetical protein
MLASGEAEPDFSRGCAGRRMGHLLFATHPHAVREWFYASPLCLGILAPSFTELMEQPLHLNHGANCSISHAAATLTSFALKIKRST